MNTDIKPVSLPTPSAEKPELKPEPKVELKAELMAEPKRRTPAQPVETKVQMINPAWAEEVVAGFGLTGVLAKLAAAQLAASIAASCAIKRGTTRAKIAKLVRAAVATAIE